MNSLDPPPISRRGFLQSGATASAAAASFAARAADSTIRIGMIGCGGRCSGAALQAMQTGPDVRLVAMCDLFGDRLEAARKQLTRGAPDQVSVDDDHCFVGFDGYQKVIDSVDVVLIACASKFHPAYSEAAIRAGKHVFVEKPHGIDPVGARRMQRACDLAAEKGLSIMSGLQSRHHAGWQETVRRIHEGAIGDIISIQSMFLRGPYRLVKRAAELSETEYQFSNWYHFCWLSGDDVTQSLVHNLDRVSWLLKGEMPESCFGLGGRSSSFGEVYGDMFDHHSVVYSYASGVKVYALCRTQVGCYNNGGDIILGSKGTCDLGSCTIRGETTWRYRERPNNPYQAEHDALFAAIRSGQPVNSGDYMAKSTMLAIMGQVACYSGKPVTWDKINESELQFGPSPELSNFATEPPTRPDASGNYPLPKPGIWT